MSAPETPSARAGWLADVRRVLNVIEAYPELPDAYITAKSIDVYLYGFGPGLRREFAAAEQALADGLGVTFTPSTEPLITGSDTLYYVLTATLPGGTPVKVKAIATDVAEQRVTGQIVTPVTEWVRLPAEPEAPAEPDDSSDEDGDVQS